MRTFIAAVITAVHTIVYTSDPDATRAFFRDVLEFPSVDTGGGWLIFRTGSSELGVHPSAWEHEGQTGGTDQQFEASLICDDLTSTISELTVKGRVGVADRAGRNAGANRRGADFGDDMTTPPALRSCGGVAMASAGYAV